MDEYTAIAYRHARSLTLHYSSSFGLASRLFDRKLQPHIYAIYGLVRIADEIVDTYRGADAQKLLDDLETETYAAIERQYSVNPIVHAFALTAKTYGIDSVLISPFFNSMRYDLRPQTYDESLYHEYIYGSAEVVGLMCLRVFCEGNDEQYTSLEPGARSLGAAYQKVNFLRDIKEDFQTLNRQYFPDLPSGMLDEKGKQAIVIDIEKDFAHAAPYIDRLPLSCREAVRVSYTYYSKLLAKLKAAPVETIKTTRIRIPTHQKLEIFARAAARQKLHR